MRHAILLPLAILVLVVATPGLAQELETFEIRAVNGEAIPTSVDMLVSIDPALEGSAECSTEYPLALGQLDVQIPALEVDFSADPPLFLEVSTQYFEDTDSTMLFVFGFTVLSGPVAITLDLPGSYCDGTLPLNWEEYTVGLVLAAGWDGVVDSIDGLTPDADTPFVSCAEEGLKGALFGLCNAYCEAMMCGTDQQQASDKACSAVARNYSKKSGGEEPPCVGRN